MSYPGISARPASLSRSPIATLDNKPKKKKSSHDPSWDVAEDVNSLPEVPFLHIPSMTYAIVGEENPRDIASRIVDAAVALSSVGNYNDEKAVATISTISNIKISIYLFKHGKNNVFIEVQRLSGDVVQYHYAAKTILQAARNISMTQTISKVKPTVTVTPDRVLLQPSATITVATNQNNIFSKTMENIHNLLRKDRIDANILGMESWAHLTDVSSSNEMIAIEASKAVLMDGAWQDSRNILFTLVMDHDATSDSESDDREHTTGKLILALKIIGNALSVACHNQDSKSGEITIDSEEMKDFMDTLKGMMGEEETSSEPDIQLIYYATRCVAYIIELSHELRLAAADISMFEVVRYNIEERALNKYHLLQNVSDRIMMSLGGIKGKRN